jgi:hypothetical protein
MAALKIIRQQKEGSVVNWYGVAKVLIILAIQEKITQDERWRR